MESQHLNDDVVIACADLVDRAGASGFEIGYVHDDVPVEEAGWYAHATYRGARLTSADHRSPTAAALGLAERVLAGGTCKCTRTVTLSDSVDGCRWRLMGARWEPGCDAPPLDVDATRGDIGAMQTAMASRAAARGGPPAGNRAQRRAARRGRRESGR